jgi:hypothetical protein
VPSSPYKGNPVSEFQKFCVGRASPPVEMSKPQGRASPPRPRVDGEVRTTLSSP